MIYSLKLFSGYFLQTTKKTQGSANTHVHIYIYVYKIIREVQSYPVVVHQLIENV
jgi:hypothetical protein